MTEWTPEEDEALRLALEALEGVLDDSPKVLDASISGGLYEVVQCRDAITAIKAALEAKDEPDAYGYAKRLAEAIWSKHYKTIAPDWVPLDKLIGVLTQIDNMTAGLISPPQQEAKDEPVDLSYQPDWKEEYQKAVDLHCITLDELREANAWIKNVEKLMADQDKILESQTARIVDLQTHIANLEGEL
jgi:hypothetical protein